MKTSTIAASLLISVCLLSPAHALDLSLSLGRSGEGSDYYRLGMQQEFTQSWWNSSTGRLTGYWDVGLTHWKGEQAASNQTLSFSPVLVYEFGSSGIRPFVEAGIGIAAFRHTQLEDHQLGTALQFEDRVGIGFRFGAGHALGLRAMHYSNGGLKQPNDGIEAYSLYYQLRY